MAALLAMVNTSDRYRNGSVPCINAPCKYAMPNRPFVPTKAPASKRASLDI